MMYLIQEELFEQFEVLRKITARIGYIFYMLQKDGKFFTAHKLGDGIYLQEHPERLDRTKILEASEIDFLNDVVGLHVRVGTALKNALLHWMVV